MHTRAAQRAQASTAGASSSRSRSSTPGKGGTQQRRQHMHSVNLRHSRWTERRSRTRAWLHGRRAGQGRRIHAGQAGQQQGERRGESGGRRSSAGGAAQDRRGGAHGWCWAHPRKCLRPAHPQFSSQRSAGTPARQARAEEGRQEAGGGGGAGGWGAPGAHGKARAHGTVRDSVAQHGAACTALSPAAR